MQYFGRAIGSVSRTWNSLNPSTLSGAIDVVVVQQTNGDLHCSAFHIRFGKISLLRPSQKAVDFYVNDEKVDFSMKLGEGGEAFFVFPTHGDVPASLLTSPVVSPSASPSAGVADGSDNGDIDVDFLDISNSQGPNQAPNAQPKPSGAETPQHEHAHDEQEQKQAHKDAPEDGHAHAHEDGHEPAREQHEQHEHAHEHGPEREHDPEHEHGPEHEHTHEHDSEHEHARVLAEVGHPEEEDTFEPRLRGQDPERIDRIIKRLREVKIPSSHSEDGSDVIMDMTGYKAGGTNTKELEKVVTNMLNSDDEVDSPPASPPQSPEGSPRPPRQSVHVDENAEQGSGAEERYVKTLRLSSDALKSLNLKPGKNDMKFVVRSNQATVTASIFLWQSSTPVVISDIDGTITRSDAMGHLMTLVGRDWTHAGVGRLYSDIANNGYNIMYLTSRSVGLADVTRGYLNSIVQDGYRLPAGPVILSPDRTMAALKREVIMRKPEIFKMACLRDIKKLYEPDFLDETPFYAGFGNRITDGLSYRSVNVPSTKIFTINTDSEVRMELLELSGIKSSYILIRDLVDQLFPPNLPEQDKLHKLTTTEFSDLNFWRNPVPEFLSDDDDDEKTVDVPTGDSLTAPRSGGIDWEGDMQAQFTDDEYDSEADEDYEDSGQEDEDVSDDEDDEVEAEHEGREEEHDIEPSEPKEDEQVYTQPELPEGPGKITLSRDGPLAKVGAKHGPEKANS